MASVGRFIMEFKKEGLKEDQIYCDVGGLGLPMADALAEAGWNIHRVNFGGRAQDSDAFVNRSAEMWFTVARLLEKCEIIMPDDDVLAQQLTQRRCSANKNGKLNLESKSEMKARGLSSPDRADAVVMAVAAKGQLDDMLMEYVRPSLDEVLNGSFPEDSLPDGMDVGL
jgi:phage terminase large subunit